MVRLVTIMIASTVGTKLAICTTCLPAKGAIAANPMDSIPMIANAHRRCRNVGSIVAITSSRSSAAGCSFKLFFEGLPILHARY